jgi:hypothetical protein
MPRAARGVESNETNYYVKCADCRMHSLCGRVKSHSIAGQQCVVVSLSMAILAAGELTCERRAKGYQKCRSLLSFAVHASERESESAACAKVLLEVARLLCDWN